MSAEDISQDAEFFHPDDVEQPGTTLSGSDEQLSYSQLALIAAHQQSDGGDKAAPERGHKRRSTAGQSIQPFLLPAWEQSSDTPVNKLHERLEMIGVHTLTDDELITVAFSTRSRNSANMVERMQTLLENYSLHELLKVEFEELCRQHGLRKEEASQLQSLLEIARRLTRTVAKDKYPIRSPLDAANLFIPEMRYLDHEEMRVLLLDTKHFVVANLLLYRGTVNSSVVRSAEVFKPAVTKNCPGIIIAHNHPSGSIEPSPEDIQVTEQLVQAGKLLEIELLDHLIIGSKTYLSLKERLMWK